MSFSIGDIVDYRRVLDIPCKPIRGTIVERYLGTDDRFVVDFGPSEYEAPYDRNLEICWSYNLTKIDQPREGE